MNMHKLTYEQYCCVLQQNIVFEETVYHNGSREINCTHYNECRGIGGCTNRILKERLAKNIASDN